MVNRSFCLSILAIMLVFGMTFAGCSNGSTGGSVPEWAHGTWYDIPSGYTRAKIAEVSSTELILYRTNGTIDLIAKFKGTYSSSSDFGKNNHVEFEFGRELTRHFDNTFSLSAPSGGGGSTGCGIYR